MNLRDTFVVIDTNVLLKPRLSDVLMDMRKEGLFSAHWTRYIDAEYLKNMRKHFGYSMVNAQRRLTAMKARCPEWEISPTPADMARVPPDVDDKDRPVAAAAITILRCIEKDSECDEQQRFSAIILTENTKDFAKREMGKLGVKVMRPGHFLNDAYKSNAEDVLRAIKSAASELKSPPYTIEEMLFNLREQGAKAMVESISARLGLNPVKKARPVVE